jgi:hypothetical protein
MLFTNCDKSNKEMGKIIFLHHSTGWNVWLGRTNRYIYKLTGKSDVKTHFKFSGIKVTESYNIAERFFPKATPYGWNNYPFDYYNIWVKHSGEKPYLEEPTLEILTSEYDVVIFKHCFPVSNILPDIGKADINSDEKRLENYKLQYAALKGKMHEFPEVKFILWTPAVRVKNQLSQEEAERTYSFYKWIIDEWDEKGDNIFIWDFYSYETEGGLYLLDKNAVSSNNSHPNVEFSTKMAQVFAKFIYDVIENNFE